jgi:hypothetical protein
MFIYFPNRPYAINANTQGSCVRFGTVLKFYSLGDRGWTFLREESFPSTKAARAAMGALPVKAR